MIIRIITFAISVSLLITIFQRSNSNLNVSFIQKDLTNDNEKHYFAKNDIYIYIYIYFAIGLRGPNPEIILDPTYFTFEILQTNIYKVEGPIGFQYNSTKIPFEFCGKNIQQITQSLINATDFSKYICPTNRDFFVSSNFNSKNYEIIQLSFHKWTGPSWKSSTEIENVFLNHNIDFSIVSSYFDFSDYENPVHLYLQDLNYFFIMSDIYQETSYHVFQNQGILNDNLFFGSQGASSKVNFYSIEKKYTNYGKTNAFNDYFNIFISLDQQVNQYKRTVYSFVDMLGFLGGIFGLMKSIAFVLVQFVANRKFYVFVISNLSSTLLPNDMPKDKIENQINFEANKNLKEAKSKGFIKAKVAPFIEPRSSNQSQFSPK